ncbi:unnamed protein product [Brassicogethes aeneus]|uniref:HotDog ACOT-type domain-containing protein n=1 Tax=Brassicogethes aeneus TaxID=1431903 RepID=A0A9P0ASQ2_BRAAE|nr:unnamed protein product [Brassicogethes aeneus]
MIKNLQTLLTKSLNHYPKNRTYTRQVKLDNLDTMDKLKENLKKSMGIESGFKAIKQDRKHLEQYLPKKQEDLPPRSMEDSFIAGIIPLSTDKDLQDKYSSLDGSVRKGRLMEDMDIFAVMVAQKHICDPNLPEDAPFPQVLVTVVVDKIEITEYKMSVEQDIRISGHVCWSGKSSMEIVVWLEQIDNKELKRVTRALFVIAARDPTNTKAAVINPIKPANENEKMIFAGGLDRKKFRQEIEALNLYKTIPTVEEQHMIHNIFTQKLIFIPGSPMKLKDRNQTVWMGDSTISTNFYSHPENRNLHNTVFGGFIMRQACEATSVLGYRFSGEFPRLKTISDIRFLSAVPVFSFPAIHAFVVYTEGTYIHMMVYIDAFDPITKGSQITNRFNFTYSVSKPVREVIPLTYNEAMMYIDGRRHLKTDSQKLSFKGTKK